MRVYTFFDPIGPRRFAILALAVALAGCIGGREPLRGPGVERTDAAFIKVVRTVPRSAVHDVVRGRDSVRVLVEETADARAVAILFAGGLGATKISESGQIGRLAGNFLVRSRHLFWGHGVITAVFDSPSYESEDLRRIHDGPRFAGDVGAVIAHLKARHGLPVWVIGTSRGTVAAAAAASRLQNNDPNNRLADGPDGVVLTASLFEGNRFADVFDLPLQDVRIPALIVHHRRDGCEYTSPRGVPDLKARLANARPLAAIWFDGGYDRGNPCQAGGHHGFRGIESQVVDAIAAWMADPTAN